MVKSVITCMYYNCKRKHNEAIDGVMWTLSQCDYPLNALFHTVSKKFEFVEWSILNHLFKPDILFKFVFVVGAYYFQIHYTLILSAYSLEQRFSKGGSRPPWSLAGCFQGVETWREKNQLLLYFFV